MSFQPKSMQTDIYNNGDYIKSNKTLHAEDTEYKFFYIKKLLKTLEIGGEKIRILDVGGGAGFIGKNVCEYYKDQYQIEFYALDISSEILSIQKKNNPYIKECINKPIERLEGEKFDIILMIDVIEHIPDHIKVAQRLNHMTQYVIYNIPTERNLFDRLRNVYFKNTFYKSLTDTLGHIHFFSYFSAIRFIREHHILLRTEFPNYSRHILKTPSDEYQQQKDNWLRKLELDISSLIYRFLKPIAPLIIQGSLFVLAKSYD